MLISRSLPQRQAPAGTGRRSSSTARLPARFALFVVTALVLLLAAVPQASAATFGPVADTYVDASNPSTSYGSGTALRLDGSPLRTAYLRFDVQGVSDFSSATLRLYVASNTSSGFDVRPVAGDSWSETMTYDTAPAFGGVVASSGPVAAGTWVDLDVSSLVSSNGPVSMALTTDGSTAIRLDSSESANPPELIVPGSGSGDVTAPSAPHISSATPTWYSVDFTWDASTDDVGVAGYTVYRDGIAIATVDDGSLAYTDTNVSPETSYQYAVDAHDAAGNHSDLSNVADVTTTAPSNTYVAVADADAYVNANKPNANYGSASALRVDGSPDVLSYLQFSLQGVTDTVNQATLRLYANSSSSVGFDAHGVTDNGWGEETITYANAPAIGGVVGSSGPFSKGFVDVDVTPLVSGNGTLTIALTTSASTAISFSSREGPCCHPPELFVTQGPDNVPPYPPGNLLASVDKNNPFVVDLSWDSTTDDVGVAGYTVYRDGVPIGTTGNGPYVYTDTTVQPATTYAYALDAFDAAGNHSDLSEPVYVTTPPLGSTLILTPDADAYVNASNPDTNYGSSTSLRVDGSPDVRSYLRFTVQGVTGSITRATLRIYAYTSSPAGHEARAVADDSWDEGTITYANAPAIGAVVGSSGRVSGGTWVDVDVTPLVSGNGTVTIALTTSSSTAIRYASRETGGPPQLVLQTG
jgi:chitodextrinase